MDVIHGPTPSLSPNPSSPFTNTIVNTRMVVIVLCKLFQDDTHYVTLYDDSLSQQLLFAYPWWRAPHHFVSLGVHVLGPCHTTRRKKCAGAAIGGEQPLITTQHDV